MEEQNTESLPVSNSMREALIHDLILVVKSAMVKVNSRDQMWCDIIASTEKQVRRVVEEKIK